MCLMHTSKKVPISINKKKNKKTNKNKKREERGIKTR